MYIYLKTTLCLSLFIGQKPWRGKKKERGKEYNVSIKKKIVQQLSQNRCTNISSHDRLTSCTSVIKLIFSWKKNI